MTGLTGVLCAVARYDFAEHGGAVGTINLGVTVPDNAILIMYTTQMIEPLAPDASIVGFTLDDADTDILSRIQFVDHPDDSAHAWNDDTVPRFHTVLEAGAFQVTQDREVKFIIQDEPLTAGVVDCYVVFLMPQA